MRKEFAKIDDDNSGFITKGTIEKKVYFYKIICSDEMLAVVGVGCSGDKVDC